MWNISLPIVSDAMERQVLTKRQYKKYKYNNVKFSTFRTVITLYLSIANTESTDQLQLFVTLSQVLTTLSLQLSPVVCCYISSIVFPCYRETLLLHTSWRQTPADIHNNFSPATAQPSTAVCLLISVVMCEAGGCNELKLSLGWWRPLEPRPAGVTPWAPA